LAPAEAPWTVRRALDWTVEYFTARDVEAPRRSAEWLLSEATGLSRIELYAHHDRPLSPDERGRLRELVKARASGTPLQYVTGEVCFRHLVLAVRPGVFIPRPETEVLVDAVLEFLARRAGESDLLVADLCTGSGAAGLSIAHEQARARVWATELVDDTADAALGVAARCGMGERVTVLTGDLFEPLPVELRGRLDAVVSNPPYIPSDDMADLPAAVSDHEPHVALDGGPDGLDVARRIAGEAQEWLRPDGLLAMELDTSRCNAMADELRGAGYRDVSVLNDLTGRDRIVVGRRSSGD